MVRTAPSNDAAKVASGRPDWLPRERYPFEVRYLGHGAETVAYLDEGTGPVLLLVHVGLWSFVWRDLIVDLRDTHRCIAVDPPATGLSGGAAVDATLANAADAVHRVVERLDLDDITLVVHDLGGPAALLAARHWPDRVVGIAAVNTFGWRPDGVTFRGMLAVMGSAPMRWLDVATGFLPRLTAGRFGVGRHLTRPDRGLFRRGVGRRGRSSFPRYMASVRRVDFGPIESSLDRLATRPTLTIFGERNDPLGFQPLWAQRCATLRQVQVSKAHHFPMCDRPDLVATAIRTWHRETLGTRP